MRKKCPKPQGFTLIELLITIAIIAILAVVAVAVYQGQIKNARNSARRADIQAIANAMEAQKQSTSSTYPAISASFFAGGKMPSDPINVVNGTNTACTGSSTNTVCKYCYSLDSTPITSCSEGATFIDTETAPPGWSASATWTVCANLETTGAFCRSNSQ